MFRHKEEVIDKTEKQTETPKTDLNQSASAVPQTVKPEQGLKELIEKNLKWSQIIYEQNRKINNKLLWSAIANWLRVLLILVPLVIGIIFLPALLKDFTSKYGGLWGGDSSEENSENSMDNFFKLFNLDPAKQEQLKALLK